MLQYHNKEFIIEKYTFYDGRRRQSNTIQVFFLHFIFIVWKNEIIHEKRKKNQKKNTIKKTPIQVHARQTLHNKTEKIRKKYQNIKYTLKKNLKW